MKQVDAGGQGDPWCASLSAAELALCKMAGLEPLGTVTGLIVHQVGLQGRLPLVHASLGRPSMSGFLRTYPCVHAAATHPPGVNFEDVPYEEALMEASALAVSRLASEAGRIGAHGVLGAKYAEANFVPSASMVPVLELSISGTAVRHVEVEGPMEPFTSNLRVGDFVKLLRRGLVPARLVAGVGAVRSVGGCAGASGSMASGSDLRQRSDALEVPRRIAVERLEQAGSGIGEILVGMQLRMRSRTGPEDSQVTEVHAVGTVVSRFDRGEAFDSPLLLGNLA